MKPTVSVILTLLYPRDRAPECIESWTARQTLPRDQIELIVAGNGTDLALEGAVRGKLGGGDHLLHVDSTNEMQLYHAAASRARAPWLMFTEAHVVAEPDCLARLLDYVDRTRLHGACVRTRPMHEPNRIARLENRMYAEGAATWTQSDDWRKFTKRGFLLRRAAYEAVGGLDYRYERFAELALAAQLHAQGVRVGYAADALITHYSSTELGELLDYAWEFRRQGRAYEDDHPELNLQPRPPFEEPPPRTVRSRAKAVLRRCFGPPIDCHVARLRYWLARLRFACALFDDERGYRAFMQVWDRFGDYAVADYVHGRRHADTMASHSRRLSA